ncbi:MAG: transposase [Candidatus Cloacimonetes bacterium]|nr:transposase [Candidatus Cloacimonadota bacterium]
MEKQIITLADQGIAARLATRKHFLKDIDQMIDWKRINKILSKVEIRRTAVAGRDAFSAEVMFRIMLIQSTELKVEESKDPAARWIKKGKKSIYGFKGHTVADKEDGLVQAIEVTPASVYDGHVLKSLLESLDLPEATEVLADTGYCSQANEELLKEKNLVSRIMQKKKRHREMAPEIKASNQTISKQRYRAERSFGALKRHLGWGRSIYRGLKKTADYLLMGAISFNLKRSYKILLA